MFSPLKAFLRLDQRPCSCFILVSGVIMRSIFALLVFVAAFAVGVSLDMPNRSQAQSSDQPQSAATPDHGWIDASNHYTQMLLAVEFKHRPEFASREGLSEYDTKISQPTWADVDENRKETEAVIEKLKSAVAEAQAPE